MTETGFFTSPINNASDAACKPAGLLWASGQYSDP